MQPKNIFLTAFCATAIFFSFESFATDDIESCCEASEPCKMECMIDPCPRDSYLQIGANYTYAWLKQDDTETVSGSLGGAQAMYEYRPMNSIYAAVKGMWRQGKTTGGVETRHLIDIDAHERVGYTFVSCDQSFWSTVFTGIGYHYWGNHINQTGPTMHANYNDFYVPVGFTTDYKIGCWFWMGLNFTWMPQVHSTIKLLPVGGADWLCSKRFGNFLVEVPFTFYLGEMSQFSFIFKPFYERWQHGHSTAITSLGVPLALPAETCNFVGAEFNFGYHF